MYCKDQGGRVISFLGTIFTSATLTVGAGNII